MLCFADMLFTNSQQARLIWNAKNASGNFVYCDIEYSYKAYSLVFMQLAKYLLACESLS
jgi:hypothetical protein